MSRRGGGGGGRKDDDDVGGGRSSGAQFVKQTPNFLKGMGGGVRFAGDANSSSTAKGRGNAGAGGDDESDWREHAVVVEERKPASSDWKAKSASSKEAQTDAS